MEVHFSDDNPQDEQPAGVASSPTARPIQSASSPSSWNVRSDEKERPDHFRGILQHRRASEHFVREMLDMGPVVDSTRFPDADEPLEPCTLTAKSILALTDSTKFLKHAKTFLEEFHAVCPSVQGKMVEIAVTNFSYKVPVDPKAQKIRTVYNSSMFYDIYSWMKRKYRGLEKTNFGEKHVLHKINLTLKPGRMYLVLGPPASGKSSLLKAIAGRLSMTNDETVEGSVLYNGLSMEDAMKSHLYIQNDIAYIEQLDNHAPRLSVKETFAFAFDCKAGGTHAPDPFKELDSEEGRAFIAKVNHDQARVNLIMEALGLDAVADTFVGNSTVRGVSGGQRRRVTVGEMLQSVVPLLCGDEISTGLDAASTYDICFSLMNFTRLNRHTRVISLLQPSPQTVSLFDEVILLSEGRILFAGPIAKVEKYFARLGYVAPDCMDVADFLQVLATEDGPTLYHPANDVHSEARQSAYSNSELADIFLESDYNQSIIASLKNSWEGVWTDETYQMTAVRRKYATTFGRQTWLNISRNITIWLRDKRFLFANAIKNLIMGVSVGGVFYQTDSTAGIYGVCFQVMLFIMLGAMTSAPALVDDRVIFYKHADANFYSAFPYVIGNAVALMPQALTDVLIFGSIIYWMVGLAADVSNFFIFIAILFVFSISMNQMLAVFTTFSKTKTNVQGYSSVVLLFLVLFCGFIVNPDVIPRYYIWIYWWNPLAWSYRALLVNQFQSSEYDSLNENGQRQGDVILSSGGFTDGNGNAYPQEWIAYNFAYLVGHTLLCLVMSGFLLQYTRVSTENAATGDLDDKVVNDDVEQHINIPFTQVNLTFQGVCYDVKASTGGATLRLLTDVSGVFAAGRMCALMGSSGAGKTTLMDTIAMRKNTGKISGDIRMNGFEQQAIPFRRCSGYVEQFDVQSPELTVRETVLFSAHLRLDSTLPEVDNDEKQAAFVDSVLKVLELSNIDECLVGDAEEGTGLSFEQRKRLSIAVELAASPSIIFLDEPTSGLDSRAALIVCRALRTIASTGRTVIATIHQPSSAVFELFDDLLLLKKGGQTVFFGELGESSSKLVTYFESKGATPIEKGENPANWMLSVITAEDSTCDYALEFTKSTEFTVMSNMIEDICSNPDSGNEIKYDTEFAAPRTRIQLLMNTRLQTIYWRSPAYNLTRMIVSCAIAFILGSVYMTNRDPPSFSETEMSSILSTIFISFIIVGVLSITSVLPVMLKIRDSYYRHRAAGMVGSSSIALALGTAEKWFIVLQGVLFTIFFMLTIGIDFNTIRQYVGFFGFFTFNIAIYSYFGQAFMCSVKGSATAQILASVFIGLNNFFSGLIVRPQSLTGLFAFTYWITPGHFVYEGLVISLFQHDNRTVFASEGSEYYMYLDCNSVTNTAQNPCGGTVLQYIDFFFGGKFSAAHIPTNAWVLGVILVIARLCTYFALRYLKFTAT